MDTEVLIHVDHPLWEPHPKYGDLIYPVNYGYIQEFKAPDAGFQDAYLFGIDMALDPI